MCAMPDASASRTPEVSILIVTRNTCAQTLEAIESVFSSPDALGKEVILIDNGSGDDTLKAVSRDFPQVVCHAAGANLGFAKANNLAARQAGGEFLLLLNSDARLQPEALGLAVDWMRGKPECGVVGGQLLNPDGSAQNSIANFPSLATELLNKSLLRGFCPRRFPGKEQRFSEPVEVESVVGAFLLTRKALWNALDGLDERFFFFLEETDFCLRARRAGARIMHLPQVKVWHGQGQTARQMSAAARIEYWRSRYSYFQKHRHRSVRLILRIGLLLRLLADWHPSALITLATLGQSPRWRQKLLTNTVLLTWHFRGRPANAGLPR